jgi:hypothetical protein
MIVDSEYGCKNKLLLTSLQNRNRRNQNLMVIVSIVMNDVLALIKVFIWLVAYFIKCSATIFVIIKWHHR